MTEPHSCTQDPTYPCQPCINARQAIDPIKLCCGQRQSKHAGAQCPDGKVMCCLCFDRFEVDELAVDPADGMKVNVCKPCRAAEDAELERRARSRRT